MSKRYLFGDDFTYTYFPVSNDGTPLVGIGSLDSAYIFTDTNKPDRDAAQAGTNAVQTLGSWTVNGNGYDFAVDALDDPDIDSATAERSFWLGINYVIDTGEQTQTDIVQLQMTRSVGYGAELSVSQADLSKYYPNITSFVSEAKQSDHINEAIEHVKSVLKARRIDYYEILDADELREPVIWRSLYQIALALVSSGEVGFEILMAEAKDNYENALSRLSLRLDTDLDGEPDQVKTIGSYARIIY